MKKFKTIFFVLVIFVALFVVSGYFLSDDFFFNRIIVENHITTPEEAFEFVNSNTFFAQEIRPFAPITPGLTPRYMLTERKYLWCDESAIVLATLARKLGFETRLVDIIGEDNIAHHTYLEILQNGEWKSYDTVKRKQGLTRREIFQLWELPEKTVLKKRPYPNAYNWFVQNNFYLKHLALRLRGIPG